MEPMTGEKAGQRIGLVVHFHDTVVSAVIERAGLIDLAGLLGSAKGAARTSNWVRNWFAPRSVLRGFFKRMIDCAGLLVRQ